MLACTWKGSFRCSAVRTAQRTRLRPALPVAPALPAREQLAALPASPADGSAAKLRRCFTQAAVTSGLVRKVRLAHLPAVQYARRATTRAASARAPGGALRFVPTGIRSFTLRYGLNFVGIYLGVYWLALLGIYSTITAGVAGAQDIMHYMESAVNKIGGLAGLPLASWLHISEINPDAAPLMAAWLLAKPTEPLRLVVSAAITPEFTRWVRALQSTTVNGQRALRIGISMLGASFALEVLVIGVVARKDTSGVDVETGGKVGANEYGACEAGEDEPGDC